MPNLISRLYNFVNDKNNGIPITSSRVDAELNQLVSTMNQSAITQPTAPSFPIDGELWIDSTNHFLKQYRFNEWVIMGVVQYGTIMATPQSGDVWIDNSGSEVVYNVRNKANSGWIALGQNAFSLITGDIISSAASTRAGCLLCDGTAYSRTTYASLFSAIGTNYGIGDGSTTFNIPNLSGRTPIGAGSGVSQGTISAVNTTTDQLTVTANNSVYTGTPVLYKASSTAIGGLTSNTTYYAIRISPTVIQLATTLANAVAGTQIDLTSGLVGTDTLTVSLTTRSLGDQVGEETHAMTIAEMPSHNHIPKVNNGGSGTVIPTFVSQSSTQDSGVPTENTGGSGTHNTMQPSLAVNWFIKT